MQTLILTLHIIVCVLLVVLVLLQSGKEGMGVIFGGGSGSVFGGSGAGGMLSKLTAFVAVLFVFTCLSYTYVTSVRPVDESVILDVKLEEVAPVKPPVSAAPTAPAAPVTTAPAPTAPATSGVPAAPAVVAPVTPQATPEAAPK